MKINYKKIIHFFLIIIIALLAYANSFSVPFTFDDHPIIEDNNLIQDLRFFVNPSAAKVSPLYYYLKLRYVSLLSFAINYQLHGLDVLGYHVTNLAIHIINAFLVYLLILLTFAAPSLKDSSLKDRAPLIALITALLFVAHPVQTMAVTYIVQRYMSLASLFYLLSLVVFIKWRLVSLEISRLNLQGFGSIKLGVYIFSLVTALLGMMSKENVFTLPFAITLYELLFFQEKWHRRLLFLIPFFLTTLVIPLGFIDLVNINKPLSEIFFSISRKSYIATSVSRWDYLFTEFVVIVTYLRLLILPINQNIDYHYPIYRSLFDPQVLFSFLFLMTLVGLACFLIYRYRDKIPATRLISYGIFWFFLTLAVESSFMPMVDVINEHRLYLPVVGAFMAFTTSAFLLALHWENQRPLLAKLVLPVLIVLVLIFTGVTYKRNHVWQSEESLWRDVLEKSPNKARPYNELAAALNREKRYAEAIPLFQKAIRLLPNYSYPYLNLGVAYSNLGKTDKAIAMYKKAIKIRPDLGQVYNNLGVIYNRQGKRDEAEKMFRKALQINPNSATARQNLENLKAKKASSASGSIQ
jgi:tetratricopeptide (TPR) repeat protein